MFNSANPLDTRSRPHIVGRLDGLVLPIGVDRLLPVKNLKKHGQTCTYDRTYDRTRRKWEWILNKIIYTMPAWVGIAIGFFFSGR